MSLCQICFDDLRNEDEDDDDQRPLNVWTCHECEYHLCEICFIKTCWDTHRNKMPGVPFCFGCGYKSSQATIRKVLGEKDFDTWQSIRTVCIIKYSSRFVPCPGPGCLAWYCSGNNINTKYACRAECTECDLIFCVACKKTWKDNWKDYNGDKDAPGKFHHDHCKGSNHIDDAILEWMNAKNQEKIDEADERLKRENKLAAEQADDSGRNKGEDALSAQQMDISVGEEIEEGEIIAMRKFHPCTVRASGFSMASTVITHVQSCLSTKSAISWVKENPRWVLRVIAKMIKAIQIL